MTFLLENNTHSFIIQSLFVYNECGDESKLWHQLNHKFILFSNREDADRYLKVSSKNDELLSTLGLQMNYTYSKKEH